MFSLVKLSSFFRQDIICEILTRSRCILGLESASQFIILYKHIQNRSYQLCSWGGVLVGFATAVGLFVLPGFF